MDKKREAQLLLIHQMYKQHPLSDFGFTFWPLWSHRLDNTKTVSSENWIKFVTLPLVACTPIKVYPTKLLKNYHYLVATWWIMILFISIEAFLNFTSFCLFYITVLKIAKNLAYGLYVLIFIWYEYAHKHLCHAHAEAKLISRAKQCL